MKMTLKNKLRLRFVLYSVLSLALLLGSVVAVSAFHSYSDLVEKADLILRQTVQKPSENTRYFSVSIHPGKGIIRLQDRQNVSLEKDEAARLAKKAMEKGEDKGFLDGYRYHVLRKDGKIRILFLSRAASLEMYHASLHSLVLVSLGGLALASVILILLSKPVVEPLLKNRQRQKEFITAAGHELKTPLSVMLADVQLWETEAGESPWSKDLTAQIHSMTKMTEGLILLSKMEEVEEKEIVKSRFLFSELAEEAAFSYEAMARTKNLHFTYEIAENVYYCGEEESCQKLLGILLDNAVKYCTEQGSIHFSLSKKGKGVLLTVTNSAQAVTEQDLATLSERFSRGKGSEKQKGFGLGLAIARAIVESHRGTLTLSLPDKELFSVQIVLR